MRLFLLLDRRPHGTLSPLLAEVIDLLADRGIEVRAGVAERMLVRPDMLEPAHDLYLLKSYTDLALSLAAILHDQGARILNPYPACAMLRDKVVTSRRLRAAGIPAPSCWVTGDLSVLRTETQTRPLVVKPVRGLHGAGVRIVRGAADVAALSPAVGPLLVQEYVPGDEDLKVYVVGERVFAVRKQFSPTSFSAPGRACAVEPAIREVALRCGQTFGLGLYGLDIIEGTDGPAVVDVNYFPGYRGVSDAPRALASYIEGFARGRVPLEWPAAPVGEGPRCALAATSLEEPTAPLLAAARPSA